MLSARIARSRDEYEEIAVRLGRDKEFYTHVRNKIETNRLTAPLFDMGAWATHMGEYVVLLDQSLPPLPSRMFVANAQSVLGDLEALSIRR